MPVYRFRDFELDVDQRQLRAPGGQLVELTPRHFDALLHFVERPGALLDKDALLAALWPALVVEENNLSQTVSTLRRALDDNAQAPRFIQTVPRRGFRFVAPVERVEAPPLEEPVPPSALAAATAPGRRRWIGAAAALALATAGSAAWHWRATPAQAARRNSLAVLPFKPLVPEARDEWLEFGMADSLVARLSSLPGLAVRSVGSVRRFAGAEQDPIDAARQLDVTWIVDGSIQRWGDQVRVSARLLNTASGEAAWSGSFNERFTSMFDLQDAISNKVAQVLSPHLQARARHRLTAAGGTRNLDAYQLYLAGRHQAQGIRTAGLVKSLDLYRQALALDPSYAQAHAAAAESYRRMIFGADAEPAPTFAQAEQHVARALAIDPELAEGYAGLGWNRFWNRWDWPAAEAAFRQAIALNPNEANAHLGLSQLLETLGRDAEALEQLRLAREIDPLSLILLTLESGSILGAGRTDEARQRLQRVFDIEPEFWVAEMVQSAVRRIDGNLPGAIESLERADRHADGSSQPAAALGYLLARNGQRERALALATRLSEAARHHYVPPTSVGLIQAGLGSKAAVLDALERGEAVRDVRMTLVKQDGRWRLIQAEPRYTDLMRRMKLA